MYVPLYGALRKLQYPDETKERQDHNLISVKIKEATDAKTPFVDIVRAEDIGGDIHTLDLILSAQVEGFFNDEDFAPVIDRFVSGTVLIQQDPLWIYAKAEKTAQVRNALRGQPCGEKLFVCLPPEATTIVNRFKSSFRKSTLHVKNLDPEDLKDYFDACDEESLHGILQKENCDAIVSLYPIVTEKLLSRLNNRAPSEFNGFTALWLSKAAAKDDRFLRIFQKISSQVHDHLEYMHKLEPDITDNCSYKECVNFIEKKMSSEYLKSIALPSKPYDGNAEKAFVDLMKDLKYTIDIPWRHNATHFLAEFLANRIWDYNPTYTKDDIYLKANPKSKSPFYHRSLISYMEQIRHETFASPLREDLKGAFARLDALGDLKDLLASLNEKLNGGEDVEENREFNEWFLHNRNALIRCFKGDLHSADECVKRLDEFRDRLAKDAPDIKPSRVPALPDALGKLEGKNPFPNSWKELGLHLDEPRNITENTVFTLKILSRNSLPLVWLNPDAGRAVDLKRYGLNIQALERRSVVPISRASLIRFLQIHPGSDWRAQVFKSENNWHFRATLLANKTGNFNKLVEIIFSPRPERLGKTSLLIYWLRLWGFDLQLIECNSKSLVIETCLPVEEEQ